MGVMSQPPKHIKIKVEVESVSFVGSLSCRNMRTIPFPDGGGRKSYNTQRDAMCTDQFSVWDTHPHQEDPGLLIAHNWHHLG